MKKKLSLFLSCNPSSCHPKTFPRIKQKEQLKKNNQTKKWIKLADENSQLTKHIKQRIPIWHICVILSFSLFIKTKSNKNIFKWNTRMGKENNIYMLFCLQDQQFRSWHLLKKWMWNPWWTTSASSRKTIKDPSLFWGFIIIIFLYFFKIFCQKGKLPFFLNFFQRERPILGLLALHPKDTEWEGKRKRERQSSEKSQSKDGIETCCTEMRQQTKGS